MIAVQPQRREINVHLIARIVVFHHLLKFGKLTSTVIGTQCVQNDTIPGLFLIALGSPSESF